MNNRLHESTADHSEVASLPTEQLQQLLDRHQQYLESKGKDGERANLNGADLQGTNLLNANLQEACLNKADLRNSFLAGAVLLDADLRDADLRGTGGIVAEQFGGANLFGAKLPDQMNDFKPLIGDVAEASNNAGKVFLSVVLGCFYSWVTIATTKDVKLLTDTATSPLPVIQAEVSIVWFYIAAPLVLFCLYCYQHIYLQRMWESLAILPAVFPDGRSLDKTADPWLLVGMVRTKFKQLKGHPLPLTRTQSFISVLLAWWLVPLTLFLFWERSLTRHDWRVTGLLIVLLAVCMRASIAFYLLACATLQHEPPKLEKRFKRWRHHLLIPLIGAVLTLFSFLAFLGIPIDAMFPKFVASVDLENAEVSAKPSNWSDNATDFTSVRGAVLSSRNLRYAQAQHSFLVKAELIAADLTGADLNEADLREADLTIARLVSARLVQAKLQGANLERANLHAAVLDEANLQNADLWAADLSEASGSVPFDVMVPGSELTPDQMPEPPRTMSTNFSQCRLLEANLSKARLDGANFSRANLTAATLRGSGLAGVNFENAILVGADLRDADLTNFVGTYEIVTNMRGANLQGSLLVGAKGLTANLVKTGANWESALYDDALIKELNLPASHNRMVCEQAIREEWVLASGTRGYCWQSRDKPT